MTNSTAVVAIPPASLPQTIPPLSQAGRLAKCNDPGELTTIIPQQRIFKYKILWTNKKRNPGMGMDALWRRASQPHTECMPCQANLIMSLEMNCMMGYNLIYSKVH